MGISVINPGLAIPIRWPGCHAFMSVAVLPFPMPETLEVVCTDDACELDMFELHYTYDMSDDVGVSDFQCPYCGGVDCLEEIEL